MKLNPESSDPRIDVIAKAIFTGILYGGNDAEWDAMPDDSRGRLWDVSWNKSQFRNGAHDVICALDDSTPATEIARLNREVACLNEIANRGRDN